METIAVREAAMRIGEWELTATGFEELLAQFKELSWSLYCYAINQRNWWALLVYKTLGMALGSFLAGKLPLTHDNVRQVKQLARQVWRRPEVEDFNVSYCEFLEYLGSTFTMRYNTAFMLVHIADDDLSYVDDLRRPDLGEAIQGLQAGIATLTRYGVKSCVLRDNLLHPVDYAWVINDGFDTFSQLVPEGIEVGRMDPPHAIAILAKYAGVRTSKPTKSTERTGVTSTRKLSFDFASTSLTSTDVYSDGRMTLDTGFGMVPVRSVFDELKMGEFYDLFHLLQLMRIYDLVVPVELARHRGVPSMPTRRRCPAAPDEFRLTWRDLVVPRLRLVEDPDLISALEQEIAEDQAFTVARAGAYESRDITGFLRRLRSGQYASDTARKLARKERGWNTLPAGYTYVKNHTWGTGPNRTAGHEAVRRDV